MLRFLGLLVATWTVRVLLLLALLSAIAAFVPAVKSPVWIPLAILNGALLFAAWNMYAGQGQSLAKPRAGAASKATGLVIHPSGPSRYFNCLNADGKPIALYVELGLVVENPARNVVAVTSYHLEIRETGKVYRQIWPKAMNAVRTRKGTYTLAGTEMMAPSHSIKLPGGSVLGPGTLAFYLEDTLPDSLPSIHAVFRIREATGKEATREMEVPEA